MLSFADHFRRPGRIALFGTPQGYDGAVLAQIARAVSVPVVFIAGDEMRLGPVHDALAFFDPALEVLSFPAWDCIPYDRVSPRADIVGRRLATLLHL